MTGTAAAQAGIGDDVAFATKPELARQMIERAIGAGMPFAWVAADEAYGQNTPLRDWLEEQHVSYVLAVPKSFTAATAAGKCARIELAALVPAAGWQQISCGDGAKGPRFYDWALIATASPAHHLLVRRPCVTGEASWRSSPATPRPAPPWPTWSGWPERGGRSRNASRPPRTRPAWTTTRSAATTPGTGTPPCRCSRWPSCRSPPLKGGTSACGQLSRTPGSMITTAGDADPADRRRDPPDAHHPHPATPPRRPLPAMVTMAPPPPGPRPKTPLPATTAATSQAAAVVLTGLRPGPTSRAAVAGLS